MSTTRSFQTMLNEYLPNDLFKDELIKRDFYLNEIQKDNNWKGGDIVVPFQGASASSVKFGGLTAQGDISEYNYVRGKISGYKEVWGSLIFNETDIMQHDGKVNEQSFLRILPDQVEDFMNEMKMQVSINLLCGPHFATVTDATNAATGVLVVDKVDRFQIGQKAEIKDNNSSKLVVYVINIVVDTNSVTFSATRGGAFVDLSAYSVAQVAKLYHDGVLDVSGVPTENFISARSSLLSAANGGSAALHGQTKTSYPALQAVNISGAAITAANILDKLFDAWSTLKIKAKTANPEKCLMSYKHMGSIMKAIENGLVTGSGQSIHRVVAKSPKISKYGWTEIEVVGVKGSFTLVGIQEMDDDIIMFLDMSAMTFRTNGFFQKKKSPEGLEYYRIRSSSGYQLVCDICLFGEQEFRKPATCGIIHSIPNY
jgi:hypothetical protein